MNKIIDLRSDTVTRPTEEMRRAMFEADVGDDVFGDDPTINKLESLTAQITGKEAAIFMVSGTMANQVALKVHTQPQDEVILGFKSHIYNFEAGGVGFHCGAQTNAIEEVNGKLPLESIKQRIRKRDIHFPRTSLICIENTHNMENGRAISENYFREIRAIADAEKLAVHLDGARLFNASTVTGVSVNKYCSYVDSVMFCLSKGLCSPMGSMLAGTNDFISEAKRIRKSYGGGIRQGGIVAAAGIIAIEKMTHRLSEDHKNARILAEGLAEIPEIYIDVNKVDTNILFVDYKAKTPDIFTFIDQLNDHNILCLALGSDCLRMVTHNDINEEDIYKTLTIINEIFKQSREDT